MKLYFFAPTELKKRVNTELALSKKEFQQHNFSVSWHHLERAHIFGQAYPMQHTKAHWKMLLFAFRIKNIKEIFGQIPRLLVGGVKSFVGKIPVGNTGGANVPPLKPMDIPDDIKLILDEYK